MRILFVADWRSVIAHGWVTGIAGLGHRCHILSSYPVSNGENPVISVDEVAIAMSSFAGKAASRKPDGTLSAVTVHRPRWISPDRSARLVGAVHRYMAPYDLARHVSAAQRVMTQFRPDIVHALRIPFEGMFAALLAGSHRTVVSVWGNDLTLHAPATAALRHRTRRTLAATDGLILDCQRDVALARAWGYPPNRPAVVLQGNGGIHLPTKIYDLRIRARKRLSITPGTQVVLSPRGPREYLRIANLCHALPRVLKACPETVFVFADTARSEGTRTLIRNLGVENNCILLPWQSSAEMLGLFAAADVFVSPSVHDGTPNTLIEGMAAGCLPVAGDTESIREWVMPDVNGLLCDPENSVDIADKVHVALRSNEFRKEAAVKNRQIVATRVDRETTLHRATEFYHQVVTP